MLVAGSFVNFSCPKFINAFGYTRCSFTLFFQMLKCSDFDKDLCHENERERLERVCKLEKVWICMNA